MVAVEERKVTQDGGLSSRQACGHPAAPRPGRPMGSACRRPLMSTATSIEGTETTWNPTTGSVRISPGCGHEPEAGWWLLAPGGRLVGPPGGLPPRCVLQGDAPGGRGWSGLVAGEPGQRKAADLCGRFSGGDPARQRLPGGRRQQDPRAVMPGAHPRVLKAGDLVDHRLTVGGGGPKAAPLVGQARVPGRRAAAHPVGGGWRRPPRAARVATGRLRRGVRRRADHRRAAGRCRRPGRGRRGAGGTGPARWRAGGP
jgi:hypothetical protein